MYLVNRAGFIDVLLRGSILLATELLWGIKCKRMGLAEYVAGM